MTLKLTTFAYRSRASGGLFLEEQPFGEFLTLVRGPNGAGKTPVMKGVAYALGNPADLPEEMRRGCESVELGVVTKDGPATISRPTDSQYPVTVRYAENTSRTMDDAKAWSAWLLREWGVPDRVLTTKSGGPVVPYISVILPMLWADQDGGWKTLYSPLESFIVDQEEEVTRLLLGLAARHVFRSRDEYAAAKSRVQALEATIDARRQTLESMRSAAGPDADDLYALGDKRTRLRSRIELLQSAAEAVRAGVRQFEPALAEAQRDLDQVTRRLASLMAQKRELDRTVGEVASEADLLSQNVTAQEMFRAFCGHENCGLFARTEAVSYGRRLLYLGDQVKDLKTYGRSIDAEVGALEAAVECCRGQVRAVMERRDQALQASGLAGFVSEVDAIAKELVDAELRIARAEEFQAERGRFQALLAQMETARRVADNARPNSARSDASGLDNAVGVYQALLRKWLGILNTRNLPSPLVDERFRVHFGGDVFTAKSPQSGSTRTRIVLAMHAALLEASLSVGGCHPPLLLLDAPRQQELAESDLLAFVASLKSVASDHNAPLQVVLAVKDLEVTLRTSDVEWAPRYAVNGEARYLGVST